MRFDEALSVITQVEPLVMIKRCHLPEGMRGFIQKIQVMAQIPLL